MIWTAKTEDELAALPQWVVVRTANGCVRERDQYGRWNEMGDDSAVIWKPVHFPVTVLWSYAQEIAPPPLPTPLGGIQPMGPAPHTWSKSTSVLDAGL
jgi:hypothetical protein